MDMTWGGPRSGAGRKAAYPDKQAVAPMMMTERGLKELERVQTKTGLSRNDILTHLLLRHADDITFASPGVAYPHKWPGIVMSIRLTRDAYARLKHARKRTGKSYSDLGEALVSTFGMRAQYPACPAGKLKRRKRS